MGEQEHHLVFSDLLRLSIRTFRVKPVRAVLTILGMAIGIGVVLFLVSLGYGLQYILIGRLVTTEDSLITMEASYPTETNLVLQQKDLQEIAGFKGVIEVSPIAEFSGELRAASSSGPALIAVRVVEPAYFRLTGSRPDLGGPFGNDKSGVVLSSQTLPLAGLSTSSDALMHNILLNVFYQNDQTGSTTESKTKKEIPIVGVTTDDTEPPLAIISPNDLMQAPPFYHSVLVKAQDIDTVEVVRDELINKGLIVSARVDLVNQARKITNVITIVLGVFGITALIVSAIGMFNTMIVGFLERIYEVGVLKSIGATDSDVRNLFLMESAIMGVLGGSFGVLLGYGGGQIMNTILSFAASRLGGKPFDLFITPLWFVGLIIVLSIGIGLFSGFWPARRASMLSPKEAFLRK